MDRTHRHWNMFRFPMVFAVLLGAVFALSACKSTKTETLDTAAAAEDEEILIIAAGEDVEPAFTEDPDALVIDPLTGSADPAYAPAGSEIRRIALLLPLSGTHSGLGHDLLDAASLALFDIGNPEIELVVADTRGTAEGGAEAARQILAAQPDLIVGPLFAHVVRAAAPIAQQAGINVITLSSDLTVAQPGIYVLGLAPEDQIEHAVAHAASQGYLRFAALAPQTAYGQRMVEALESAAARYGGKVTVATYFNPDGLALEETVRELTDYPVRQADIDAQIAELRTRGDEVSLAAIDRLEQQRAAGGMVFDALLIPASGQRLQQLSSYLGYHDVTSDHVRLLGLASWNDPTLLNEQTLRGAWFATTPDNNRTWFSNRFASTYDEEASRLATLAYDAMALAAALTSSGAQGDFSERAITDWRGFQGVDGLFRFRDDGTPERGLVVFEITPRGFEVVDPAPATFEPPAVSMLESDPSGAL
jgi:branched-chain amino acid transport system substrate-binding protein